MLELCLGLQVCIRVSAPRQSLMPHRDEGEKEGEKRRRGSAPCSSDCSAEGASCVEGMGSHAQGTIHPPPRQWHHCHSMQPPPGWVLPVCQTTVQTGTLRGQTGSVAAQTASSVVKPQGRAAVRQLFLA